MHGKYTFALPKTLYKMTFENDIEQCLSVLRNGGTILYPTDTIWGIGCDATDSRAVEKIISLKQRPDYKSFVILVADEKEVLQYTATPDLAVFDYLQQTNKPTTVIYEHALGLADNAVAADGSIAIRICKDAFCRHLIKRFGKPLISTSANVSGGASPANFSGISTDIIDGVDYVVQYRRDEMTVSEPSSIVKWENGEPFIIRP
jgi:L-threonylcarbamoyladenylate synthase